MAVAQRLFCAVSVAATRNTERAMSDKLEPTPSRADALWEAQVRAAAVHDKDGIGL